MDAPESIKEEIVLVRRNHEWSEGGKHQSMRFLVFLGCMAALAPLLLLFRNEMSSATVFRLLGLSLLTVLIVALSFAITMKRLRCRLVLSPEALRLETGHGLPIDLFAERSWSYRWDELTFEGVKKSWLHPAARFLHFQAPDRTLKLNALEWFDPNREEGGDLPRALLKQTFSLGGRKDLGLVGEGTALVRLFDPMQAEAGDGRAGAASSGSASATADNHPAVLAVVALFMALMVYGWFDHYFGFELYRLGGTPWPLIIAVGFSAAALAAILLRLLVSELAIGKLLTVAVLFGLAAGLAGIPALNRVSYWSADGELSAYRYQLQGDYRWAPIDADTPEVVFDLGDYWAHFEAGEEKSFMLVRGGLGYWLIDMGPIYEDQRRYYEGRRADDQGFSGSGS